MTEYHVRKGTVYPRIYAGIIKKDGSQWQRKSDVTDEAIAAVLELWAEEAKKWQGKGMEWTFDNVQGYKFTVTATKIQESE